MLDWLSNLFPVLVVVVGFWSVRRALRQPLWAEAWRRLKANRLALIALSVIGVYALVGFCDSIAWRNDKNANSLSLIDRAFSRPAEPTYSAPLANKTFGEPTPRALQGRHLLGTDGTGQDVVYLTLKGCRTALIIGGFTLLIATPLALLLGMLAGYFGKRVDDAVQYTYTVLDSIPNILLLIAMLLVLGRGLPQLCVALGITSWVGLCRLARGETLKHREREYVRAARALGISHGRILMHHILPNLLPIIVISVTLGFSGLVLSEAILSYLQLGVAAGTGSWGNMIDASRLELARDPVIWWNLAAASAALFILVLAFNLFGDALRDAIDPRLNS
ncbi:oligopeptide transport system permease protein OppC [Abditibacteriota bacterium]|nr:oligopeptide transport system permease protein OppC [Abditibacteriota bacterium]